MGYATSSKCALKGGPTVSTDIVTSVINRDPTLAPLYAALAERVLELGQVIVEPKKTSVHLKSRVTFAGIHVRKGFLLLQIVTSDPIQSDRVVRVDRVSANRMHNHVRVASPAELDAELMNWLAGAYALAS